MLEIQKFLPGGGGGVQARLPDDSFFYFFFLFTVLQWFNKVSVGSTFSSRRSPTFSRSCKFSRGWENPNANFYRNPYNL